MAAVVAIARLGREDAALLLAARRTGGVTVEAYRRVCEPSLDQRGEPLGRTSDVLTALLAGVEVSALTILLPPGIAVLRRAEVEVPVGGAVTADLLNAALAEARATLTRDGEAVLSCRPVRYTVDGADQAEPPVGQLASALVLEVVLLAAPLAYLSRLDALARDAGCRLAGVVTTAEAVCAALLPSGEGTAVRVGHEDTLACRASGGLLIAQARAAIGRRHLEGDLAQAFALEPSATAARLTEVLAEPGADPAADGVLEARLAELSDLIAASAAEAGLPLQGAMLSGLPAPAAARVAGSRAADLTESPPEAEGDTLLLGAAYLLLGLRGSMDHASLPKLRRRAPLSWLIDRF